MEEIYVNDHIKIEIINWSPFLVIYEAAVPADTDVFTTSLGRLKKVTTSYDQTRCC